MNPLQTKWQDILRSLTGSKASYFIFRSKNLLNDG